MQFVSGLDSHSTSGIHEALEVSSSSVKPRLDVFPMSGIPRRTLDDAIEVARCQYSVYDHRSIARSPERLLAYASHTLAERAVPELLDPQMVGRVVALLERSVDLPGQARALVDGLTEVIGDYRVCVAYAQIIFIY